MREKVADPPALARPRSRPLGAGALLLLMLALAALAGCGDGGSTAASTGTAAPTETLPVDETAVRGPDAGPGGGGYWIGIEGMSSQGIEVIWAEVADVDRYELVRLDESALVDPSAAVPEDGEIVYSGLDNAYTDRDLTEGAGYLYMIVPITQDGVRLEPRWREVVAVDDTESPSKVSGLAAERTADGVRLSWDQGTENYRFSAYDVRQLQPDGEYEWIGGAYALEQTAFLDDRADPDAEITYEVVARDFHHNQSEPTRITVPPA